MLSRNLSGIIWKCTMTIFKQAANSWILYKLPDCAPRNSNLNHFLSLHQRFPSICTMLQHCSTSTASIFLHTLHTSCSLRGQKKGSVGRKERAASFSRPAPSPGAHHHSNAASRAQLQMYALRSTSVSMVAKLDDLLAFPNAMDSLVKAKCRRQTQHRLEQN